jgi:protocatechuate 3,4-dioxygenase beta subunit
MSPFHPHDDDHDDFGGLHRDLRATGAALNRRSWLRLAARLGGAAGTMHLIGCGETPTSPTTVTTATAAATEPTTTTTVPPTTATSCSRIPEETAGPYPGDGSNGPNALTTSGVIRSDIRASFGGLSGGASGIPLTLDLTLVSATTCAPIAGRAIYLWHCDAAGRYSLYSSGVTNQNFLRGVQEADANGRVTFTTVFPGCYTGRWPHIHFEVFPNLAASSSFSNRIATSQLALPKDACDAVYATAGYESSVRALAGVTLASDTVFRDGVSLQLASVAGSPSAGFTATLTIAVPA